MYVQLFVPGSSSTIPNTIFPLALSLSCTQIIASTNTLRFFTCLHIHLITGNNMYLLADLTISIPVCPLLFYIPSGNERVVQNQIF